MKDQLEKLMDSVKGLKDRAEYMEYKEWMKVNYPQLPSGALIPDAIKQFKIQKDK